MELPVTFSARVVSGRGRGKTIGVPTLNLNLADVPSGLNEGIYACRVSWGSQHADAAMHLGPRPVFQDSSTCELYLLDRVLKTSPPMLTVAVIAFLRPVRDFPTVEALTLQIEDDVRRVRGILAGHA